LPIPATLPGIWDYRGERCSAARMLFLFSKGHA